MGMCVSKGSDYGFAVPGVGMVDRSETALCDWIEMWDYVGGIRFRGFVAQKQDEKAMFVFFDQAVLAGDLKAG